MKYLLSIALFFYSFNIYAQRCQVNTKTIQPGQVIEFQYDPSGTDLESETLFAKAKTFEEKMNVKAYDVEIKKDGNQYKGSFKVPQNAQVIIFQFENEMQTVVDNNDKQGYVHIVHSGNSISKSTYLTASFAVGVYARVADLSPNKEKAKVYFEKAIGGDNSKKLDFKNINAYANLLKLEKNKEELAKLKPHIEAALLDTKNASEEDLSNLISVGYVLQDDELNSKIKEHIIAKYPKGENAFGKEFDAFREIENTDEAVKAFSKLQSLAKGNKNLDSKIEYGLEILISKFVKDKDYKNVEKYISKIESPTSRASIYNNLSWDLAGGGLEGEAIDVKFAEKISRQSLDWVKEEMQTYSHKPDYRTAREWKKSTEFSYGMYSDTYALAAYKLGKIKEATAQQKIAIESYQYRDVAMNQRYAIYLEKDQGPKEVISFLEKMISGGHANSAMKEQFEKLYKANISIDEAYELYFAQLEKEAKAKHLEEIKKSMIEKDAPSFTLTNLKGETVSLESLKGKVVVLDFWATWCGPCVASFPGMQKAVNKYATDDEVEFVFVDTWESGKNKEKMVKEFLDKKGYDFNVLMDNENTMVADYDVDGIPAKFILDQNGKIRFNSKGFGGNDDALVDELSSMIEILKNDNSAQKEMGTRP